MGEREFERDDMVRLVATAIAQSHQCGSWVTPTRARDAAVAAVRALSDAGVLGSATRTAGPELEGGWHFTPHALARIAKMGIGKHDVVEAVNNPATQYPGRVGPRTRQVMVRAPLAVVVDTANNAVLTVMWDKREGR